MLTFNLKKEWFEKIKSGEKTHEYRVCNEYWSARLEMPILSLQRGYLVPCCFTLGYPPRGDKTRRLYGNIKKISLAYGENTDLKIVKPVYDIEFELI